MTEAFDDRPAENIQRGTIFALIAVPAGVILFVVLWNLGFVASIVGFAVAWGASKLYRIGAGGVIGRAGAIRIAVITIATLLLALFAGVVSDFAKAYPEGPVGIMTPEFWETFWAYFPALIGFYGTQIVIALAFGVFGCFSILRGAFVATRPSAPPTPMEPLSRRTRSPSRAFSTRSRERRAARSLSPARAR